MTARQLSQETKEGKRDKVYPSRTPRESQTRDLVSFLPRHTNENKAAVAKHLPHF